MVCAINLGDLILKLLPSQEESKLVSQPEIKSLPPVFDRSILLRQAMNDKALADEVLGLFLLQLAELAAKDWSRLDLNFEMHTLKGSAAVMGAMELEAIGRNWREFGIDLQGRVIHAISAFQAAAA